MEGPSIRNLMQQGTELFEQISSYLKSVYKVVEVDGVQTVETSDKEIEETCENHGRMALLLDSVFSKLNTQRGLVTSDLIGELEKELFRVMNEWVIMGLSQTPKMHCMVDHTPE